MVGLSQKTKVLARSQRGKIGEIKLVLLVGFVVLAALVAATYFLIERSEARPRLAQDIRHDHSKRADVIFKQNMLAAFPIGSSEKNMLSELDNEGFEVKSNSATFDRSTIVCRYTWSVSWKAANNVLRELHPKYESICL